MYYQFVNKITFSRYKSHIKFEKSLVLLKIKLVRIFVSSFFLLRNKVVNKRCK